MQRSLEKGNEGIPAQSAVKKTMSSSHRLRAAAQWIRALRSSTKSSQLNLYKVIPRGAQRVTLSRALIFQCVTLLPIKNSHASALCADKASSDSYKTKRPYIRRFFHISVTQSRLIIRIYCVRIRDNVVFLNGFQHDRYF